MLTTQSFSRSPLYVLLLVSCFCLQQQVVDDEDARFVAVFVCQFSSVAVIRAIHRLPLDRIHVCQLFLYTVCALLADFAGFPFYLCIGLICSRPPCHSHYVNLLFFVLSVKVSFCNSISQSSSHYISIIVEM